MDDINISEDDERVVELSTLQYTFPELVLDEQSPLSATLELPVVPSNPVPVLFADASDLERLSGIDPEDPQHRIRHLEYLPNIRISITLPDGYPADTPPLLALSTASGWLPEEEISRLLAEGVQLWEDIGHDQVLYSFIDHVQDSAQKLFGLLEGQDILQLPPDLEIELLDHNSSAKQAAFDRRGHDCGICLEPKRGSACHRMDHCGHIFCRQCLQDFYNNAITEGDVHSVKCLDPGCAKSRAEKMAQSGRKGKPKVTLSPSELLKVPLEHEMVKRYVQMKHKIELENDKTTVYCPRNYCEGAARSKKHKKPVVSASHLATVTADETDEEAGDDADEDGAVLDPTKPPKRIDLLRICEDCSFAFCSRCLQSWHGEFVVCGPPRKDEELTAEDLASMEYIRLHTTPCPTCAVPAQKTHGCNHMQCQRCETHFCYLCSAWLDPQNPYQHYNTEKTSCYQRLWELEGGDGDDVGLAYEGGHHDAVPFDEGENIEGDNHHADWDGEDGIEVILNRIVDANAQPIPAPGPGPAVPAADVPEGPHAPVAHIEAPLVLRIDQIPPRAAEAPRPHARAAAAAAAAAPAVPGRLGGRYGRAIARREAAARAAERGVRWPPAEPPAPVNPEPAARPAALFRLAEHLDPIAAQLGALAGQPAAPMEEQLMAIHVQLRGLVHQMLNLQLEPGDLAQREVMGGDDGEDAPAGDAGLHADREEEIDAEYDDVGERPLGRADADRVRAAGGFLEFDR